MAGERGRQRDQREIVGRVKERERGGRQGIWGSEVEDREWKEDSISSITLVCIFSYLHNVAYYVHFNSQLHT